MKARHNDRVRSVQDILKDPRTCPEETIYQLGTRDGHEDPNLFCAVVAELFMEIQERYGSNLKILDWALHLDEETPHIHERHVFFADDGYGHAFPKQEKACEALGFERPDPEKKQSKNNNRKMSFDAEIRSLYIEIAEKHGMKIEKVPLEGKIHMEKNDFIIARQEAEIASNEARLDELILKISDIDALAEEVAEEAYEKACEVVAETVKEETIKSDIDIVKEYRDAVTAPEIRGTAEQKNLIKKVLDVVMKKLARDTTSLITKVKGILSKPEIKKRSQEQIAESMKESILERLAKGKSETGKLKTAKETRNKNSNERNADGLI